MQAWRTALQSRLSQEVSVAGVTLARFIWAGPIAAAYLAGLYLWQDVGMPVISGLFMAYVIGAALMQILATSLMVYLFKLKNFAVGAGLAKSEALVAAILGLVFFGTYLSALAWFGIVLGAVAVFMLSSGRRLKQVSVNVALIGLASGAGFALTSLWIREASFVIELPFPHRAAWVLMFVITIQTAVMLSVMLLKDKLSIRAILDRPKLTLLISITSALGSIGWFSAMSLQSVPMVKTLGQVEVFFTMLIAVFWLKDKLQVKDMLALVLIALAALLVMWG